VLKSAPLRSQELTSNQRSNQRAAHGDLKKVRFVRPTKKQAAKGQIAVTIKCPGLRK